MTRRRAGRQHSCPCWNARACGCCSQGPWSARTGAASCGCLTAEARRRGRPRWTSPHPGWAVVGYSRAQALSERAVLPVTFGALDGEARWLEPVQGGVRAEAGPHRLSGSHPTETTRPALFTALRTGFADALLRRAFEAARSVRAKRRAAGLGPRGLGKLLVGRARSGAGPALPRPAQGLGAAGAGGERAAGHLGRAGRP